MTSTILLAFTLVFTMVPTTIATVSTMKDMALFRSTIMDSIEALQIDVEAFGSHNMDAITFDSYPSSMFTDRYGELPTAKIPKNNNFITEVPDDRWIILVVYVSHPSSNSPHYVVDNHGKTYGRDNHAFNEQRCASCEFALPNFMIDVIQHVNKLSFSKREKGAQEVVLASVKAAKAYHHDIARYRPLFRGDHLVEYTTLQDQHTASQALELARHKTELADLIVAHTKESDEISSWLRQQGHTFNAILEYTSPTEDNNIGDIDTLGFDVLPKTDLRHHLRTIISNVDATTTRKRRLVSETHTLEVAKLNRKLQDRDNTIKDINILVERLHAKIIEQQQQLTTALINADCL
jgi:hypothetical protein